MAGHGHVSSDAALTTNKREGGGNTWASLGPLGVFPLAPHSKSGTTRPAGEALRCNSPAWGDQRQNSATPPKHHAPSLAHLKPEPRLCCFQAKSPQQGFPLLLLLATHLRRASDTTALLPPKMYIQASPPLPPLLLVSSHTQAACWWRASGACGTRSKSWVLHPGQAP